MPVQIKRVPPENLLAECPAQAVASDGKFATILRTSIERSEQYQECKDKHKALSDWNRNEGGK